MFRFTRGIPPFIALAMVSLPVLRAADGTDSDGTNSLAQPEPTWQQVFDDRFDGRTDLGSDYVRSADPGQGWRIVDGVLVASQLRPEHGTVLRRMLDFGDITFSFDFRFRDGDRFNVVFDDSKEQTVHAGHICRVSVSRKSVKLSDDKKGSMNNAVRAIRLLQDPTARQEAELQRRMKGTFVTKKVDLTDNEWHRMRIRIFGSQMHVELDGAGLASLDSPGIDHASRDKFGFTVVGNAIEFDNLKVSVPRGSDGKSRSQDLNFVEMMGEVPESSKFIDDDYYIWGGSMVRDREGKCHLLYSRWPRGLHHNAWVTHSEIAHAVSDRPAGPYRHVDVALPPRGAEFWDGLCTHNPTVHEFDGKYYLYYMGNTGDHKPMKKLNWSHRNNQRIGLAVADHPAGPWKRFDTPLIDVSDDDNAPDALMASNPSILRRKDGTFVLIYKAVGKEDPLPKGGPVVHLAAISDSPTGPFKKQLTPLFTAPGLRFPAEDPYVWSHGGRCWAIVNDHKGVFNKTGSDSLALFSSTDGLTWEVAENPLVLNRQVTWSGGTKQAFHRLERPQLWLENGVPSVLFCAAEETAEKLHSYNVHIPLDLER